MHAIEHLTFTNGTTKKKMQRVCDEIATRDGDYGHGVDPIRFNDAVMKNKNDAFVWLNTHDRGWYDCLAVRYKDGRKYMWLVKIEYHC